jgi:predicted Na+-dependent transporter
VSALDSKHDQLVANFAFNFNLRLSIEAVLLLLTTSSPGGSYSNWWCFIFNADLALSVAMTTVSSIASVVMLPLNLTIYLHATAGSLLRNSTRPTRNVLHLLLLLRASV